MIDNDTIAAVASAPGRGGVGVVRLSGPQALTIAARLTSTDTELIPREARFSRFVDDAGEVIDNGLVIAFPEPASFTGENVAELQGHGSPIVLDALVRSAIALGARMARPGEFSERAYLNGKLDLAQAEAVADLINAASSASARAAVRSLQGDFSRLLNNLVADLLALRVQVEAAIDFPDEDIELLEAPGVVGGLTQLLQQVEAIVTRTRTGVRLNEGARVVLVGAPNVGKSSVLNQLCGEDRAIVTAIAGTTRDLLREQLLLDGIPVELVDTAGLRQTADEIEAEGVRRAELEARQADLVLAVFDLAEPDTRFYIDRYIENFLTERSVEKDNSTVEQVDTPPVVYIGNKNDLVDPSDSEIITDHSSKEALTYRISAKTGAGITELTEHLVGLLTGGASPGEQTFSARTRHLLALENSRAGLAAALAGISNQLGAELVAEHLRFAQDELGSVCGEITTDALLGEIFSSFCIGK